MRIRLVILFILFFFRCILGLLSTLGFSTGQHIRVTGYPDNVYQNNSKCILKISRFLIRSEEICAKYKGEKIRVFGSVERSLLDSFNGSLWLRSGKIDTLESDQGIKNPRLDESSSVDNFREKLVSVYKSFMPEPEAGLVSGIVLGYKKDIGQEFYEQMVKSGTIHIAVASGYNILLVGGSIMAILFWVFKRPIATLVSVLAMILYAMLAGGDTPVVRAVWMASLMYLGLILGRSGISGWILALTVWIMLMFDPTLLVSASFQLSVAASFGLMIVEPWLSKKLEQVAGGGIVNFAANIGVLTTVSTMVLTIPIIWWHFGRMSLIGIVSNILILPFVPPLMIFGSGMILFPWLLQLPVYVLAHWVVGVIRFFGS